MLALDEIVKIGNRMWKVGAVCTRDGERYYMLTPKWRRGIDEVSLLPAFEVERWAGIQAAMQRDKRTTA